MFLQKKDKMLLLFIIINYFKPQYKLYLLDILPLYASGYLGE